MLSRWKNKMWNSESGKSWMKVSNHWVVLFYRDVCHCCFWLSSFRLNGRWKKRHTHTTSEQDRDGEKGAHTNNDNQNTVQYLNWIVSWMQTISSVLFDIFKTWRIILRNMRLETLVRHAQTSYRKPKDSLIMKEYLLSHDIHISMHIES